MAKYNHQEIEAKWQKYWEGNKINKTNLDGALKPFYNLMMFPYPSAEGLHIGGMYTFTGVDTFGRYMKMNGYDVFEPIGLDAFGIHSENYALKIGEHIKSVSQRTEKHFYEQLKMMGNMYDFDQKLETNKPEYYKWTQWLFSQFFKAGLAYRKNAHVKFCPSCKTVLSDEQVIDEKCERCSSIVEEKALEQWFFKITDYADRLNENLNTIDWDKDVKIGQKNWINKKVGVNITYQVDQTNKSITVFTTRPDTNFGATFIVLAPEHDFVNRILNGELAVTDEVRANIAEYVKQVKSKSDIERLAEGKEKTGVFTGYYCINQLNNKKLPIWISDFVLGNFGTGAVVGVPGHDKRDFEFAKKFDIEIIRVVTTDGDTSPISSLDQVQEESGIMINSQFLDGLDIHKATEVIADYLVEKGWGEKVMNFNLRDWCVSRQRYWGPPIPMIYCADCAAKGKSWFTQNNDQATLVMTKERLDSSIEQMKGWYPDENLPVQLPDIADFEAIKPDGSGRGPLASQSNFVNVKCPECHADAKRETDVSDPFVDSCWYFLRYPFVGVDQVPFGGDFNNSRSLYKPTIGSDELKHLIARMEKWGPVNYYIGGKEHTVLHLLYARFITMALHDLGYLKYEEPFTKFYGHGLITKDGAKMSKSKGNVVNPDEFISKYGSDAVRLYLRFIGPFDQAGDWRDTGMEGMYRSVNRVWKLFEDLQNTKKDTVTAKQIDEAKMHSTIMGVGKDLADLKFNTAVAKIMEFVNWYLENVSDMGYSDKQNFLEKLALLLAPFTPHLAEEFWVMLGNNGSIHHQAWPTFDSNKTISNNIQIAIQINGKLRGTVEIQRGTKQEAVQQIAQEEKNIKRYLENAQIVKVIFVPDKIINFIIK